MVVAELTDIITVLERDRSVWQKVAALDRAGLKVICCCNSERCQRVRVEQTSGRGAVLIEEMATPSPDKKPAEIVGILDACRTNPTLKTQVAAFNRSRFDVTFTCRGGILIDWTIGDA